MPTPLFVTTDDGTIVFNRPPTDIELEEMTAHCNVVTVTVSPSGFVFALKAALGENLTPPGEE